MYNLNENNNELLKCNYCHGTGLAKLRYDIEDYYSYRGRGNGITYTSHECPFCKGLGFLTEQEAYDMYGGVSLLDV